jgi:hypothetical protein
MPDLKLIALDAEDLAVFSAHLQDAILRVGDMTYRPGEKRFAAILRRFNWQKAFEQKAASPKATFERRQSALRFERVLGAKVSNLDLRRKTEVLSLLAFEFAAHRPDDPAGTVTLSFAGGGAIRLDVECIEAELRDLGPAWRARSRPRHPIEDNG